VAGSSEPLGEPVGIVGRVAEERGNRSSDVPGPVEVARPGREIAGERSQGGVDARPGRVRNEPADEAMLRAVYEEHERAVTTYAARLLQDHAPLGVVAADITQETFLRAWRNPEVLTLGPGPLRGWLLTVAKNLVNDQFRAAQARVPEASDATILLGSAGAAPDHADRVAAAVAVHSALSALSDDHRQVLQHVYWKERSTAEAAADIGISAGTVKSRTHYALAALRKRLSGRGEGR
jgi:RNA polymerase sigma-70 factor, ECF subfamily